MIRLKKNWREKLGLTEPQPPKARRWDLKPEKAADEEAEGPMADTVMGEFIRQITDSQDMRMAIVAEHLPLRKAAQMFNTTKSRVGTAKKKWRNDYYSNTVREYRYVEYYQSQRITVAPSIAMARLIAKECNEMVRDQFHNAPPVLVVSCNRVVWLHVQRRHLREMEELLPQIGEVVLEIYKKFSY